MENTTIQKTRFTFSKHERLGSRKALEHIFKSGKKINESTIQILWMESDSKEKALLKIAISVPKKNFKKAVDRNKIKRQIREAYRLNKHKILPLIKSTGKKFSAVILFTGKVPLAYPETEAKIILTLQRFASKVCDQSSQNFSS
ncbi:MAG: ribonuclease P protein component [Bacteroidia bacterium]